MVRKKHGAEQIVAILRQIEVELANHKSTGQACKEAGITQQTPYRWRKEYGGLKLEQARRLKALEKENNRLRRLVTASLVQSTNATASAGSASHTRVLYSRSWR
jgi:transposase-like protein